MGFLDKEPTEHITPAVNNLPIGIPFIPQEENRPPASKPTITFCDARIGSTGNITLLTAHPGRGKSAVCEALIASHLSPAMDTFQLKTHLRENQRIVFVDGERSQYDTWISWKRILQRARIEFTETANGIQVSERDRHLLSRFEFQAHCTIPDIPQRMKLIEKSLAKKDVGILVLDGLGDFILDVNRLDEVVNFFYWVNFIMQEYQVSIFGTLHLNPGSDKPRGHIGSEFMRRSESCLNLDIDPVTSYRKLTTDWQYGKVRSDKTENDAYFKWDPEAKMFVSTDGNVEFTGSTEAQKKDKLDKLAGNLDLNKEYTHKELTDAIMKLEQCAERTAKTRINEMIEFDLLTKEGKLYKLFTEF